MRFCLQKLGLPVIGEIVEGGFLEGGRLLVPFLLLLMCLLSAGCLGQTGRSGNNGPLLLA